MPTETIVAKENVMQPGGHVKQYMSTFPLSAPFAMSYRFGEYGVVGAWNIGEKETFQFRMPHELRSPMLKSPMMQAMNVKKDYFVVYRQAYLPFNWEILQIMPTKGDIVPKDANTCIENIHTKIASTIGYEISTIGDDITNEAYNKALERTIKLLLFCESIYCKGSLVSALGYPMHRYFTWKKDAEAQTINPKNRHRFGLYMDYLFMLLKELTPKGFYYTPAEGADTIKVVWAEPQETEIDFKTALCKMRDDYMFSLEMVEETDISDITTLLGNTYIEFKNTPGTKPFNYERLLAYQIVTAHYYSNDKIDYVYTAELWRQKQRDLQIKSLGDATEEYFEYNGMYMRYDTMSGHYFDKIFDIIAENGVINPIDYEWFRSIFGYNRSLRFVDYFTGARSQPLAVADYNVAVNDSMVSVIDVTKKLLTQRLGNALNRVGNRIESQVKELLGIEMKPDYHNPFWLGHTSDTIGVQETENTGDAMFSSEARNEGILAVTGQFRSNASSKQFTASFDRKGILLCLIYFDIPRLYTEGIDRFFFQEDIWDEFNPIMQFTGDQPIYRDELLADADHDEYFGYAGKDMQYKQRIGRAAGAFCDDLPGWVFLADQGRNDQTLENIGPSYIRSLPTEIDELYQSLVGYSIDTYYHFIMRHTCEVTAKRPMAYNPGILQ